MLRTRCLSESVEQQVQLKLLFLNLLNSAKSALTYAASHNRPRNQFVH